ncbi:uncharacterized protein LOC127712431 [Mytilus californianus]|uniref:uncharacterized protein LOC127712431 n=1 Tax=Mytilus californianus TaxID=6549 RepID=UPI00224707D4|nr:uncharacterized protein LOC127712431 [Mytilus californianus]XP_052074828.1 uncharacterized protein LOC127712431 [Mytilus californianus]XP_052074829.1 uncharacterized protein LOC127712431 [Mytilus californianus]
MTDVQVNVECLGSAILSKTTTSGLGSIQKPLYEKYIQYRKSGKGKKSQPAWLKVSQDGITVIFPTDQPGHTQNYFYERSSINFFEAVRLASNKGSDKKHYCAFLPVDETRTLNQGYDKLFFQMDKKHHSLTKVEHPVVIACVMRRQVGVRALDCHGFITEKDGDAFRVTSAFFSPPPLYKQIGQEYSEENEPRYQNRPPLQGQKPDLIQTEYGPYGIYKGGKPVNFSGDHFHGNTRNPEILSLNDDRDVDRYAGNIEKDERQFSSRYSFENRNDTREYGEDYGAQQTVYAKNNRHSAETKHDRHTSGEIRNNDRRDAQTNMQGSFDINDNKGRLAQHDNKLDSHFEQERGRIQSKNEFRIPRPMSPLRNQGRELPVTAPKPQRALSPEPRIPKHDIRSHDSSHEIVIREPISPREYTSSGPVSSVSNKESRQEPNKKPVAKVPPHLVAGIKVLPTGFVPKLDSPKNPKRNVIGNIENYYSNEEDPYDNAMSRQDYYNDRRNVHSDGYEPRDDRNYGVSERQFGNKPPPDILPSEEIRRNAYGERGDILSNDRWKSKTEFDNPKNLGDQQSKRNSAPSASYGKPWTYGEQLEKFKEKEHKAPVNLSSSYTYEPKDSVKIEANKDDARKEHDYANLFSRLNTKDDANIQLETAGTNFESSLGYFP